METGCKDKLAVVKKICEDRGISLNNVCYIGDDINDIDIMKSVGYGCCPKDAIPEVKLVADYITMANGGEGVIREIVDQISMPVCSEIISVR